MNPEYAFEEVPMPYNITLQATNAGTKDVDYSVMLSPQRTALTDAEIAAITAAGSIREFQKMVYANQGDGPTAPPPPSTVTGPAMPTTGPGSAPMPPRYDSIPPQFRPQA
jgi:hypothetical protein